MRKEFIRALAAKTQITCFYRLSVCLVTIFAISSELCAQNTYELRFDLASLDTVQKVACYDVQIRNVGVEDWSLGGANLSVLYDASIARLIDSSGKVTNNDNMEYGLGPLLGRTISTSGTSLPYEENLGFFRINIIANVVGQGLLLKLIASGYHFLTFVLFS